MGRGGQDGPTKFSAPPRLSESAGPGALEKTTGVALPGLPAAPENRSTGSEPPAQRGPTLPHSAWRGPHPSAVFPIKAGIPGWS